MRRAEVLWAVGIAALLGLYGFAFWRASHPDVSTAYRAFFIDKTREVMDDDGSRVRTIGPGQRIDHASADLGFVGFSGVEPEYRWTNGYRAQILFKIKCGLPYAGRIVLELSSHGNQRVVARLNGGAAYMEQLPGDSTQLVLNVPPRQLTCGLNTLQLELPDAAQPNISDPRKLGVALRWFRVE